jgi:Zn-dependent protease with chaperone function/uncharacterized RDD family membrane protein YckC
VRAALFRGPESLRVRGERARLVLVLAFLPLTLALLGIFLQSSITLRSLLLIVIGAMLFVALSRGRLLGAGVRIREGQFENVYSVAEECARTIGVETPHVFLRDDLVVPIVAVGTGEPYSLVISSSWIELFTPDELRFLIGRELAHVAAGHTKLTSLLSANGRENAIVAIAFGAWLRVIEYTADRAGLLCCGSLNAAISAIAVSTFQKVGRKIDLHSFAEQRRELDAEPSLRFGEWVGATPYATNRIARLAAFARDPLFQTWSPRFAERRAAPQLPADAGTRTPAGPGTEDKRMYAGPWRRAAAFVIDFIVVSALIPGAPSRTRGSGTGAGLPAAAQADLAASGAPPSVVHLVSGLSNGDWSIAIGTGVVWLALAAYVVVLVAFAGQTFGMMICDLRVVSDRRERIGLGRAIARYLCFALSLPAIVGIFSLFRRVQPFERWSHTRLVSGSTGGRA